MATTIAGPQQGRCASVAATGQLSTPMAEFSESMTTADVQRFPQQINRLTPSYGDLVRNSLGGVGYNAMLLEQLGANFTDGASATYYDTGATDGQQGFVTVDVATPKPGLCLELLAFDGLNLFGGGGDIGLIHTVVAGPRLAAAHAVLDCGNGGGLQTALNTCAWAGPVDGAGTPFFGEFWIYPDIGNKALANMTEAQTVAFADTLFADFEQ
jgi:hypothetical protein